MSKQTNSSMTVLDATFWEMVGGGATAAISVAVGGAASAVALAQPGYPPPPK